MSVEQNKNRILRLVDLLNAYDFDGLGEVCHEEIFYHTGSGIELGGLPFYQEMMRQVHEGFPDFRYSLEELTAEGDSVHWTYRFTATHHGEMMGIPGTGRSVNYLVAAVCQLEDGKIIDHLDVYDGLTFLRQVGVVSEEVRPGGEEWPSGGQTLRPQ